MATENYGDIKYESRQMYLRKDRYAQFRASGSRIGERRTFVRISAVLRSKRKREIKDCKSDVVSPIKPKKIARPDCGGVS